MTKVKFTSEDLMNAMGLKVGDKFRCYNEDWEVTSPHSATCSTRNLRLGVFVGEELELISPEQPLTNLQLLELKYMYALGYRWLTKDCYSTEVSKNKQRRFGDVWGGEQTRDVEQTYNFITWEDEPIEIKKLLGE